MYLRTEASEECFICEISAGAIGEKKATHAGNLLYEQRCIGMETHKPRS